MAVLVREDGTVDKVRVEVSAGHQELDALAVEAAKGWRLEPGRLDGEIVPMWTVLAVTFSVDGKPMPDQSTALKQLEKRRMEYIAQLEAYALSQRSARE